MSLTREKINELEGKAKEILAEVYGQNPTPPIDPIKILQKYNLVLKLGEFPDSNVAGAFDRGKNEIYISKSDGFSRQAFTIAHEFSHFILHKNVDKDVLYRTEILMIDKQDKSEEQEANWLAAAILMPKEAVEIFWRRLGDVESLAKLFGTSFSAMSWRLKNLGLKE